MNGSCAGREKDACPGGKNPTEIRKKSGPGENV